LYWCRGRATCDALTDEQAGLWPVSAVAAKKNKEREEGVAVVVLGKTNETRWRWGWGA
jgi:hypothetical protein